jgi:hypothetical protein
MIIRKLQSGAAIANGLCEIRLFVTTSGKSSDDSLSIGTARKISDCKLNSVVVLTDKPNWRQQNRGRQPGKVSTCASQSDQSGINMTGDVGWLHEKCG